MRDPSRIEPMLELLREVWVRQPDLRLSQMIMIAIRSPLPCPQIFYAEDDVVERRLRAMLDCKDQHGT